MRVRVASFNLFNLSGGRLNSDGMTSPLPKLTAQIVFLFQSDGFAATFIQARQRCCHFRIRHRDLLQASTPALYSMSSSSTMITDTAVPIIQLSSLIQYQTVKPDLLIYDAEMNLTIVLYQANFCYAF